MTDQKITALEIVRRRRQQLREDTDLLAEAIRHAHEAGASLRSVGVVAGMSHEAVRRIVKGD